VRRVGLIVLLAHCDGTAREVIVAEPTIDASPFFGFGDGSIPPYEAAVPVPPDALPPPNVACDDAGACTLPSSVCANAQWLEYFDDGVCVDAGCAYQVKMNLCVYGCFDGGCIIEHSTVPSP
jgi:hypothetical protein